MAVWSRKWYIVIPLLFVILGHWSLLLHGSCHPLLVHRHELLTAIPVGTLLKAVWLPGQGCTITNTANKVLAVTFIYSMAFDFVVMSLMAIKLVAPASNNHSRLVQLVFRDGLVYFIVA